MRVKIYSNEHNAWWKANYFGYTTNESEAGIFEIEEVNKKYPYIDFDKLKEDYLVKFECLAYEELEKENRELAETLELYNEKFAGYERVKSDLIAKIEELEQQLAYECGCNAQLVDLQNEREKIKNTIRKAIDLLSVDGKGTKQEVKKILSEVLGE